MSVEVKQSDREAAASCVSSKKAKREILDGVWDDSSTVQAFAAHRHQAEVAMWERCLAAVSNYREHCSFDEQLDAADEIAAAIRSIDTRGE